MKKLIAYCTVEYDPTACKLVYYSLDEFMFGILLYWQTVGIYSLYLYYKKGEIAVYTQDSEVNTKEYTLATGERLPYNLNLYQLEQWIKNITRKLPIL